MPWKVVTLRGQRVFARAKEDGTADAPGGLVEVRYRPNDGRAYRAALRNLSWDDGGELLPHEACGPAEFSDAKKKEAAAALPGATVQARASSPPKVARDAWQAYTDGACSGNPGPAGSGVVVIEPDGTLHEGSVYLGEATNNVAELTAILLALEAVPRNVSELVVHTDSKYAIGVLWKGWKAKANQALISETKKKLGEHERVRPVYVPGHSGIPLNEKADFLAREAIRLRRSAPLPPFAVK